MASYRKRANGWRVEICVNGIRDSATRTTKAEARAWAERREDEIRSGRIAGRDTVADLFDRYAREVTPSKRGERWERLRLGLLSRMRLGSIRLTELSAADLGAWRDERLKMVSAGSVLREMNLIGHVLETARREWGLIDENPLRDVRRPPAPRARNRRPTQDEVDRIVLSLGWSDDGAIETVSQRVAAAYLFAIETAMRAGEICGLLPGNVDLHNRTAHLVMTKNGQSRDVPLSWRAVELLEQLKPWGDTVFQLQAKSLDVLFRRARDNCAIEGLTFHDSRREATSRLSKKLHPLELARVTGHTNLSQLLTYYNETAAELAKKL